MIYTIRTTVRRERTVLDSINSRVKNNNFDVKAILHPAELKGYLFIEGEIDEIKKAIQNIPHVRGLLEKPVDIKSLDQFFVETPIEIKINEGEIVEVVGGPFKGEKAKVVRIKEQKREAKIELIEAVVPIPITIKLDLLKPTKQEE